MRGRDLARTKDGRRQCRPAQFHVRFGSSGSRGVGLRGSLRSWRKAGRRCLESAIGKVPSGWGPAEAFLRTCGLCEGEDAGRCLSCHPPRPLASGTFWVDCEMRPRWPHTSFWSILVVWRSGEAGLCGFPCGLCTAALLLTHLGPRSALGEEMNGHV